MRTLMLMSLALAFLTTPAAVRAQREVRMASVAPMLTVNTCASRRTDPGPMMETVLGTLALDRDEARRRLVSLQESLAEVAAERPQDVESQYLFAAVLGARGEVEGGREKIRVAGALLTQLQVVLDLEPNHAGALHIMGRLHASVMRLDWVTRFLATRMLGGAHLGSASWEEAERLLESARAIEPCTGDHYYQLARVYADQGKHSMAGARLRELLDLGPEGSQDARVWGLALDLLEDLRDAR